VEKHDRAGNRYGRGEGEQVAWLPVALHFACGKGIYSNDDTDIAGLGLALEVVSMLGAIHRIKL
jgi:hypothetical protein